jgi:CubicO group peptidase (beta-lactamase class C family)
MVKRVGAAALLLALLAACATPPPPAPPLPPDLHEAPLPTADADALGLDARGWQAAVDDVQRRALPIDQMALLVEGRLVAEWHLAGFDARSRHDLRSVTKSVTSLLVGAALARRPEASADQPIATWFPEFAHLPPARLTLRQLLSMRTGLDCNDDDVASRGHEERMYRSDDWLRFFFALTLRGEPGAAFSYCTAGIVVAGEAVSRIVQRPLAAFADEALFTPLGIAGAQWQAAPRGVADAGGHLRLTLPALLKLGELIRLRGQWRGRQLIDAAWIDASLVPQVRVDPSGRFSNAWFGLAWWLEPVRDGRALSFQARGNGGQYVIVLPELAAVIAFTGHAYNADLATRLAPLDLVTRHIAPMLRERRAPP